MTLEYAPNEPTGPYAALKVPAYRFYASAWFLAVFGQQILSVALGWDLYSKTGDRMVLGWVGLIQAIPVISLAIPAGQLADRINRRWILIFSQAGAASTAMGLVLCSLKHADIHYYYLLLFFDGIMNAIGWPSRSAILPQLVSTEILPNAVTWNSSSFQLASVIGPAVGGFILVRSVTAAYCVHLIAALWFVVCLAIIRLRPQSVSKSPVSVQSLLAGLRFVFAQKIILATITLDLFAVLLGGAVYLLPAVAKDSLHVGGLGFGLLRAAPAIGAICMGMALAHLPPMKHAGKSLLWAVAGFGLATIVFGLMGVGKVNGFLGHGISFAVALVALFLTGAFDNISVVVRHTLVQVLTPDEMRGRVSAVNNVFIGASNELGGFESGLTAKLFGLTGSIIGGGIGTLLVVLGVDRLFPQVRTFGALHDAKPLAEEEVEITSETANVPRE